MSGQLYSKGRLTKLLNADGSAATDGLELDVAGVGIVCVFVDKAGGWDGTLFFEGAVDKSEANGYQLIQGQPTDGGATKTSIVGTDAPKIYRFDVSGLNYFRTRVATRTVGTVTAIACNEAI